MTLRERYAKYLEARGFKLVASRSTKYLVYCLASTQQYYFLGSKGGVRGNKTNTVAGSYDASCSLKRRMEQWEAAQSG